MSPGMRLILLSNSSNYGSGYLDHAVEEISELFRGIQRILFVPFALHEQEWYWSKAKDRLAALGLAVDRLREGDEGRRAVESAHGVFVGGGNTFRLLDRLQRSELIEPLRRRVLAGMPYMGSSAGTVIAAPTMKTTNDMPIVQPPSFDALGLVPFQINPHYLDADPSSRHMGETREQRIVEFLEDNDVAVVGLREGGMLSIETTQPGGRLGIVLKGAGARVFRRGMEPAEHAPGERLDHLA